MTSKYSGKQRHTAPKGGALLGLAGGMLVVAGGLVGAYYVLGERNVANAATAQRTTAPVGAEKMPAATGAAADISSVLAREVELKVGSKSIRLTWAQLGIVADADEAKYAAGKDLGALAAAGSLPVTIDREAAVKALLGVKSKVDAAPINAYLDLEAREIHDDKAGRSLDVFGSLPALLGAARQGAPSVELSTISVPASVTKAELGIDDISQVLGHYETKFSVSDKDRNFNLKLAASKLNGVVLKPGVEFSFNDTVGERSQAMGYKVAHVISAGEMVDGLAGGTCQISTTLFGAAFFAGLEIVKTTNHSRPSAYTPLGFDATVVWPNTDLKLMNPYDFPVAIRYVVANGEAKVELLGKKRPYDKVVFERRVIETTPFGSEERLDENMPLDQTIFDQEGFDGYRLERVRRFIKDGKTVKTNRWTVSYRPVTEYIRRGTNPDPNAKPVPQPPSHGPKVPKSDRFELAQ